MEIRWAVAGDGRWTRWRSGCTIGPSGSSAATRSRRGTCTRRNAARQCAQWRRCGRALAQLAAVAGPGGQRCEHGRQPLAGLALLDRPELFRNRARPSVMRAVDLRVGPALALGDLAVAVPLGLHQQRQRLVGLELAQRLGRARGALARRPRRSSERAQVGRDPGVEVHVLAPDRLAAGAADRERLVADDDLQPRGLGRALDACPAAGRRSPASAGRRPRRRPRRGSSAARRAPSAGPWAASSAATRPSVSDTRPATLMASTPTYRRWRASPLLRDARFVRKLREKGLDRWSF